METWMKRTKLRLWVSYWKEKLQPSICEPLWEKSPFGNRKKIYQYSQRNTLFTALSIILDSRKYKHSKFQMNKRQWIAIPHLSKEKKGLRIFILLLTSKIRHVCACVSTLHIQGHTDIVIKLKNTRKLNRNIPNGLSSRIQLKVLCS